MTARPFALRARGESMLPLVPDGTLLLVDRGKEFVVNDIVVATLADGTRVAHRVVGLDGTKVQLRGDFNCRPDPECHRKDVEGTVVSMIRKGQVVSCDCIWFRILTLVTLFTMRRIR